MFLWTLFIALIFSRSASGVNVKVAAGDEAVFSPTKPLPSPTNSIAWKHKSIKTVIVIEWDEDGFNTPNDRFNGITTLDKETGEMTIKRVDVNHSGEYFYEVNSKDQGEKFTLTVANRVQKPVINIEKSEVNSDVAYLSCEYSETIIWRNSAGETLRGSAISPKGESITVKKNGAPGNFYTCSLRNDVSEETSDPIYEKDLFEGVEVKVAVGDEAVFRPEKPLPSPTNSITWKHRNNNNVVIKAIEWNEDGFNTPNNRFRGITTLDKNTGEMKIKPVNFSHSGEYTFEVNRKEQAEKFTLIVKDRVQKPVIKIESTDNPDVVYLKCEYSEKITWKNSAGKTLRGSKISPKGESITVKKKGDPENFYTCSLSNGVSEETSDRIYEKDLFKGRLSAGGIVGIVTCANIAIIAFAVFLYKCNCTCRGQAGEEAKLIDYQRALTTFNAVELRDENPIAVELRDENPIDYSTPAPDDKITEGKHDITEAV